MALHRLSIIWLISLALIAGCNPFSRQRQPKVPPAVTPGPPPPKLEVKRPPKPAAMEYPPPPEVQPAESVKAIPPPPPVAQTAVGPPPPRPPVHREPATKPETPPQQPAQVQVPQLTQLLTPEEEKRYNDEIDDGLARVRKNLEILGGRPLNEERQSILERINAFVQQTIETRRIDLVTARSLSQRADLLARDLERTTR